MEPATIAQIVMHEAKLQADLALGTATDHMMALDSHQGRAAVVNEFRQSVIQAIDNVFIPALRKERFKRETLVQANKAFSEAVGGWSPTLERKAISLGEVLWLHGLIGFGSKRRVTGRPVFQVLDEKPALLCQRRTAPGGSLLSPFGAPGSEPDHHR